MKGNATVSPRPTAADTTGATRFLPGADRVAGRGETAHYGEVVADRHLTDGARKAVLRQEFAGVRRSRSMTDRLGAAHANAAHLSTLLAGRGIVCVFLPLPSEPLPTELLERLIEAGTTVLVPVVSAGAALDWCRYPAPTRPGAFGIAEPAGPRLGPGAVRTADVILVPALAVDRAGRRLGRGGGHYDRTLALLHPPLPLLVAVLFDGEIVDDLPVEDHDQPVGAAVTPSGGIHRFRS